jgi:murein DD-endopeptidase MepM/ murein hydrolase activator NlpD
VLASINRIESNFGQNMGPSSAGAVGWMQFMPSTWLRWGTDADGDGVADPWSPDDAIFSAARYLAAAGGASDLERAVFAYNHADWYVREVLDLARVYGQDSAIAFSLDQLQGGLEEAQRTLVEVNERLVEARRAAGRLAAVERRWRAREAAATLLSDRLAAGKQAVLARARRAETAAAVGRLEQRLDKAEHALAEARAASQPASFSSGAAAVLQAPSYVGGYVFPVGGGPRVVSVGHDHHDYPAADIAAPQGAPVYALANAVVVRAWHAPDPRCGIGLTLQTDDGRQWVYCHLAYEEPGIQAGVRVAAGTPLGLVGSTGHATGPHLHLQLVPATSYPQSEPWFEAFAGTAFSWQDAPTPTFEEPAEPPKQPVVAPSQQPVERTLATTSGVGGAPRFAVVPTPEPASEPVILFTR